MKFLVTTESGESHIIDLKTQDTKLFFDTQSRYGGCMGIYKEDEILYMAGNDNLFKFTDGNLLHRTGHKTPRPDFHHMTLYNNKIYIAGTNTNTIWVFNSKDLSHIKTIIIPPPNKNKPIGYKSNYNHINGIINHQDHFYINLNWFDGKQYGHSGIIKTDLDFKEIERFKYGWESHDFKIVNDDMFVICGTSNSTKNINHPKKSGLLINGELVFEHHYNETFCKGLYVDSEIILIGGGTIEQRNKRKYNKAVIYVLDRKTYNLIDTIKLKISGIKGITRIE